MSTKHGLNESAFRKPYGKSRHALKISVTEDFMERLQEYVTVSKGGFGSGFVQTATEMMFAVLSGDQVDMMELASTMYDAFDGDSKKMDWFESNLNNMSTAMYGYRAILRDNEIAMRKEEEQERLRLEEEKRKNMTPVQLEQARASEPIRELDDVLVPYE